MSKLWIALGLLGLMLAGVIWNRQRVLAVGGEMLTLLEQAEAAAESGDRDGARSALDEAIELWESKSGYLNAVLRHGDTDQICVGLSEAGRYLDGGAAIDFSAAVERIRHWIQILCEMEEFSLSNVL